jgi:transcriptional regulator with XRE-family HTH domain
MSADRPSDRWAATMPIQSVQALSRAVNWRRSALNLSQRKLSEIAGLAPSAIRRIQQGDESVPFGAVVRLADSLELVLELRPRGSEFVPRPPAKLDELGLSPNTMSALKREALSNVDELGSATSMLARPEFSDGTALYELVCALNRYGLVLPGCRTRVPSDRDREIFKLRIVDGLLLPELARVHGLNAERIRQILASFGLSGTSPAASQRRSEQARRRARDN